VLGELSVQVIATGPVRLIPGWVGTTFVGAAGGPQVTTLDGKALATIVGKPGTPLPIIALEDVDITL